MEINGDQLASFSPVSDERLLLAIGRAWDHSSPIRHRLHRRVIAEHLGFIHNGQTTKRLRPQLEDLRRQGLIESHRHRSNDFWRPTEKGSHRIDALRQAGDQESLPESLQHRHWREARALANEQMASIVEALDADLEAAAAARSAPIDEFVHGETTSTQIRETGDRLNASFNRFSTGVYCLFDRAAPGRQRRYCRPTEQEGPLALMAMTPGPSPAQALHLPIVWGE